MYEVAERITVGAVFSGGKMRPAWFAWRGRKYRIEEITYTWESREGSTTVRHFSVISGANVYNLAYYPPDSNWEIKGVEQDWRG